MTRNNKSDQIQKMIPEDIAVRLDQFAYAYDPYEYCDSFGTREEGFMQALNAFLDSDLSGVKAFLTEIVEAEETVSEDRMIAEKLLQDITLFEEITTQGTQDRNSVLGEINHLKADLPHLLRKREEEVL